MISKCSIELKVSRAAIYIFFTYLSLVLWPVDVLATGYYYSDVPHYNQAWFTGSGDCLPNAATQVLGWHDASSTTSTVRWVRMIPGGTSNTDNSFESNPSGVTTTMNNVKDALDWWNNIGSYSLIQLWFDGISRKVRDAAVKNDPNATSWWVDDDDWTSWSDMTNQINNYGPMMFMVFSGTTTYAYYGSLSNGLVSDREIVNSDTEGHAMVMYGYSEGVLKVDKIAKWIIVDTGWSRESPAWINYDATGDVYTVEIRATGTPTALPSAPTGISATDGTYTNKVRVTWNSVSGASSYSVWRNTSDIMGSASKISDPDPSITTYDDTSAVAGTTYYYWVKAKDASVSSGFSSSDSGYTTPTYTISYNANSATSGSVPSPQTKTHGVDLTLRTNTGNLTRTGYTFAGWNTNASGTGTNYAAGGTYTANASVTLYAKWTAIPTYTVSYNANSATSGTAPAQQTKAHDVALTLSGNTGNLSRTGYTFAGWNTNTSGTGTDYAASGTYTANASVTLYAKWTAIPTYTVSYNANSATSGTAPAQQTKTHDVSLTLSGNTGNLSRTGYTFAGWNTNTSGTGTNYAAGGTYTANASVTLYAKWTIISPTITVTYPTSGSTLTKNTNYTITWSSSNVTGNVQIDLYKGSSNYLQLAASDPNDGSYPFTPLSSFPDGSDYRICISAMSGSVSNCSGYFTIQPQTTPTLTITYPNGGESLTKGTNYPITWSSSNVTGNVQIDLYKGSSNYLQLAASDPNDGSYPFTPLSSFPDGSDYRICISAMNGTVSDCSNSYFAIQSTVTLPSVATGSTAATGSTTATSGGNVTADGNATVTARGVCWSTSSNPTIANSKTIDGSGTGSFTSAITGLNPGTTYHVRAYATNSVGTSYGSNIALTTPPTTDAWSTDGLWHQISDASSPTGRSYTSSTGNTWWYGQDTTGNYDTGAANSGSIISPSYLIQAGQSLKFYSWEQTEKWTGEPPYDNRKVFITTDNGSTWTEIKTLSGNEDIWYDNLIDLSAYTGQNVKFKFTFDTIDSQANNFMGWYVDDIQIVGDESIYNSTDIPKSIPDADAAGVNSTITVPPSNCGCITDINVNLQVTHTYVGDLVTKLTHNGTGREVVLFNNVCGDTDNINSTFDDEAVSAIQCPQNGTYIPANPLSSFDGIDASGTWTLNIADIYGDDLGTIDSWGISITCGECNIIAPSATTNSASGVTSTGAILNGTVNANNASTLVTFQYGLTTSYGSMVTAAQSPLTGNISTVVNKAITGLTPGTTYHYRAVGVNSAGTTYGSDMTFTTSVATPAIYDATGTWNYVTSNHSNNCGDPNTNETGTYIINQTGGSFTASDGVFITYNGTVSGATYTCTFSYPENGGTTTETISVTLSSSTSGTGVSNWVWTDGNFTCNGSNDIIITKAGTVIKGDIDGLNGVTLADAILALKVVSGLSPTGIRTDYASSGADVNGDGKIGMAEAVYAIQKIAGLR